MRVLDMDRITLSDVIGALEGRPHGSEREAIRTFPRGQITYDLGRREAYSYGRHFPLFRQIGKPTRRYPRGRWLINGERWSGAGRGWNPSRTPDHQAIVRDYLAEAPTITLPFGALLGAGIELESIRALEVSDDTWIEVEREARSLAELPLWRRRETYTVVLEASELERVPERKRKLWREATESERAEREARTPETHRRFLTSHDSLPLLPDADGLYRWKEDRTRTVSPDSDGIYRYTESAHVLGEATFSAVRPIGERRRRAKYLSGFDTNEAPALYFLAELPTGAPSDIEGARLALAPPAVHAALARGRIVERQGDIFLVDTALDRAELEARGAIFARFTLWSRDARPKRGEATYRAPLSPKTRDRRDRRERARRREIWRETFRAWTAETATYSEARELEAREAREAMRARWRELEARERAERARYGPEALGACDTCGAGIGEACASLPDKESAPAGLPERLFGAPCPGERRRRTLGERYRSERSELAHASRRRTTPAYLAPRSKEGIRARRREALERAEARLAKTRADIRSAVFSGVELRTDWSRPSEGYGYALRMPTPSESRQTLLDRIGRARSAYTGAYGALAEYRRELYRGARAEARDETARAPRICVALELYRRACETARAEIRPETVDTGARFQSRRDAIRSAVSIYGTAHTATELARVRGAVYVRGVVSHRPELERGRFGAPDHRPLRLTPDRWYLAIRNTVPRARGVDTNGA
jgi:hypothetical protein